MSLQLSSAGCLGSASADFLLDGCSAFEMNTTGGFPTGFSSSERKPMDIDSASISSDSSSCSPPAAPITSSRKRAKNASSEQKQPRLPQRKGGLQLWQFLYALLEDPAQYGELIEWTDRRSELEFRMLEPEALAAWWGYIKHRPNMSYERLSRSLRFYYDKGILRKMGGERFLYRFCVSPEAMYEHIGNTDNRPSLKFVPAVVQQRMSKYVQQHQPSLFYPHCYQQQHSYPAGGMPHYTSYSYDQSSHSLPTSWNPPAVRPRLYSHELLPSTSSLPTYEDHLARSNSYPISLTDMTASNYFKTDDFSFMQHSASSSESCSPRSSTSDYDIQVDMVMQEILQLTDKYSNPVDIKPHVNSFTLFDSHSQPEEDFFKTPTCSSDDAPVFPKMSVSSPSSSSQFSQTASSLWYNNTIY